MKPENRIDEVLDQTLRRLGDPPSHVIEASRERVRNYLMTADISTETALRDLPDASPASLWRLRQPYFVVVVLGAIVLSSSIAAFKTIDGEEPQPVVVAEPSPPALAGVNADSPFETIVPETVAVLPPVVETEAMPAPAQAPPPLPPFDVVPPEPLQLATVFADPSDPVEPGKSILDRACDSCHSTESIGRRPYSTRAEYESLVLRMIANGAMVSEVETPVLAEYLFKSIGIPNIELTDSVVTRTCTACHTLKGMERHAYPTHDDYRLLVLRMIANGANIPESEIQPLAEVLFETFGRR